MNNRITNNTFLKISVYILIVLITIREQAAAHMPGGGTGGGAFGGAGAGRSFSGVSIYSTNDSAKVSFDFFSNFSYSLSSGLNQGEPLGPGGRISNMYNAFLYREYTTTTPIPFRSDYNQQQFDFGYVPIWQPNYLSGRIQYRFLPNVWGAMTIDCNLDGLVDNVRNVMNYIQLGSTYIKWAPQFAKGLYTTIGKIHVAGTYDPLFDQMPLENFLFNGLAVDYSRAFNNTLFLSGKIAAGQEFLGRAVMINDTTGRQMYLFGNLGKNRNRNHLFYRLQMGYKRKYGMKLTGGFQLIPADTTEVTYGGQNSNNQGVPITEKYFIAKQTGWHIGSELVLNLKKISQTGIIAYGRNGVQMAWGAPDFINKPDNGGVTDWFVKPELAPDFTMDNSSILYGMYWANLRHKKLMLDLGCFGVWRNPAKDPVTYSFNNSYWAVDSLGFLVHIFKVDSLTLKAQDYKTLKGALKFSYLFAKSVRAGVRYDEIHFFNPEAHSNVPEFGRDSTDPTDTVFNAMVLLYNERARWEREAINTHIITPFITIEIANTFKMQASYAFAFYDQPVYRQSRLSRRHGNFSFGTTLTYRFAKLPD